MYKINIRKCFALLYPFLRVFWYLRRRLGKQNSCNLRVLIYHDISENQLLNLKKQIEWLGKWWKIISPDEFIEMYLGRMPAEGNNLLITFDDGFKSNYKIANQLLNPLGIKAMFFVVSDFVIINSIIESQIFSRKHILLDTEISEIRSGEVNMTMDNLRCLIRSGHTIGAHTKTHAILKNLSEQELIDEIIKSAEFLEKELKISINNFAYTFGDVERFSEGALKVALTKFRHIYSGLRGNNANKSASSAILRDAISPNDSLWFIGSMLLGAFDFKYRKSIRLLEKWAKNCED